MREVLQFLSRDSDHVSQKPLSTRTLPMRRRFFVLTLLACSVPVAVFAGKSTYLFTSFDFPGATGWTVGTGVNHTGTIAGWFNDAPNSAHGCIWSAGTFTQLDVPGANLGAATWALANNDAGAVVGFYNTPPVGGPEPTTHGFIYSGANFTSVDVPDATSTITWGINNTGSVVGTYVDAQGIRNHSYLLNGGQYTTFDYPNAASTEATGINDNGQIVGQYTDTAGRVHGYLLSGGQFQSLDFPNAVATLPTKITLGGQIVGFYDTRNDTRHGFLLSNGTYTSIDFPKAADTYIYGLNDLGEIVGRWDDSTGHVHGFYAVPQ